MLLPADVPDQVDAALEQQPPEVCWRALPEELVARTEADVVADRDEVAELVVAQPFEQAERSETRFIESRRTSPAANTPGTLVSST